MNKKRRPLIIAVFDDNAHGQQAVNDLHRAGVSDDQVRLVRRGEVSTEQKNLDVPASHEEVVIERHPVTGQPAEAPIGNEETINVPVMKEQVTVEKQSVVREEIGLGKRQMQETQQVTDTVRKEEVE